MTYSEGCITCRQGPSIKRPNKCGTLAAKIAGNRLKGPRESLIQGALFPSSASNEPGAILDKAGFPCSLVTTP
jgi:hypothetical protein